MSRHAVRASLAVLVFVLVASWVAEKSIWAQKGILDPGEPRETPPPAAVLLDPGLNQLTSAIQRAGPGGTVMLRSGLHTESGTVLIDRPVTITGEPGAVLEVATFPSFSDPFMVEPALHVTDTTMVALLNLDLQPPPGSRGGTGILIDRSQNVRVEESRIRRHQFGIIVRDGDRVAIGVSTLTRWDSIGSDGLTAGIGLPEPTVDLKRGDDRPGGSATIPPLATAGLIVMSGRDTVITSNVVSGFDVGLWIASDTGVATMNTFLANRIGVRLCCVAAGQFLIAGETRGSEGTARNWRLVDNISVDNERGYVVRHGSHGNRLEPARQGFRTDNAVYDVELQGADCGDHCGPASYDNVVRATGHLEILDCGVNNRVIGGGRVDRCQ